MEGTVIHTPLPRDVVEQLDELADVELRTRSSMARWLIVEGLRRREQQSGGGDAQVIR